MRTLLALTIGFILLLNYCHSMPCNSFDCSYFRNLQAQEEHRPVQVKRRRDYDFVRFGRSEPKKKASYDYIRFGKRSASPHGFKQPPHPFDNTSR
ncbi:unnamed protein product [Auanema sp. JU1783]|nr:unnamed protein product [Auanema sp. JU1783]